MTFLMMMAMANPGESSSVFSSPLMQTRETETETETEIVSVGRYRPEKKDLAGWGEWL